MVKPMNEFSDPTPIATAEQFKKALLTVRDKFGITPQQLAMLGAHCRAPQQTITTTKLAADFGFSSCIVIHGLYGAFAHNVADALHYRPGPFSSGESHWWRTLASGNDGVPVTEDGHYEWIMRPELVQALQEMKWA